MTIEDRCSECRYAFESRIAKSILGGIVGIEGDCLEEGEVRALLGRAEGRGEGESGGDSCYSLHFQHQL